MTLGFLIINRWVIVAFERWGKDKDNQTLHLQPSTPEHPQPEDARCPSQERIGVKCPCIEQSPIHEFKSKLGDTLIVAPKGLQRLWVKEFNKFYDKKYDNLLDMSAWVQHGDYQVKSKKAPDGMRLSEEELRERLLSPNGRPGPNTGKYIIITTPMSYDKYVAQPTSITKTYEADGYSITDENEIETPWKEKCTYRGVCWGRVIRDEFHTERNETSPTMRIFNGLNSYGGFPSALRLTKYYDRITKISPEIKESPAEHKAEVAKCKARLQLLHPDDKPAHWGISGTPYGRSPGEIVEYIRTFQSTAWTKFDDLQGSSASDVEELDVRFRALQKKRSEATVEEVKRLAADLATAIYPYTLRRSDQSYFLGRQLKSKKALHKSDFIVEIKDGIHDQDASWTKAARRMKFTETVHTWEMDMEKLRQSAIRQVQKTNNNSKGPVVVAEKVYNSAVYRLRVCGTYPALANICLADGLKLTQEELLSKKWHQADTPNNPYQDRLEEIVMSSAKVRHMLTIIAENPNFTKQTKFLVFSDFPVVTFILNKVCGSYINHSNIAFGLTELALAG